MKRALALLILCAALASPSIATDRTSSADMTWNGVATGSWSGGGTPAVTDNFTCKHRVYLQANPALTSGSFIVGDGCTLIIPAGVTFQYGDGSGAGGLPAGEGLRIDKGGQLIQEGERRQMCRVTSVDWSAAVPATHTVTLGVDCDVSGISSSLDYVFFGDENPPDPDEVLTGRCVQAGPGPSGGGCFRPSYNQTASYKITAANNAAHTVTYDLDPMAGRYTGTPYAGSRYAPDATAITDAMITGLEPQWLGRRTKITVANYAGGAGVAADGDRGSWYFQFDEVPELEADPTVCSGLAFKILMTEDGGGTNPDVYWVEGDASRCTSSSRSAHLTTGARRGDVIDIYRPAVLSGNTDGATDVVGEGGILAQGGTWYARWARITQPWGIAEWTPSPSTGRAGAVMFIQGDATSTPMADWDWVDLAYPSFTGGSDVGALYFSSADSSVADLRYPNAGLMDMSASKFRHVHIHDALDNSRGGGVHGIFADGVHGFTCIDCRIERLNDDCVGGYAMRSNGTSAATDSYTFALKRSLVYECAASTDNSQEGVTFTIGDLADGAGVLNAGLTTRLTFQDVLSIGMDQQPMRLEFYNSVIRGFTSGGTFRSSPSPPVRVRIAGMGGQVSLDEPTVGAQIAYANIVEDSNLYAYGPTTAENQVDVEGKLIGTFVAGNEQVGNATVRMGGTGYLDRTVVDLAGGATGYFMQATTAGTWSYARQATYQDSILRTTRNVAGDYHLASVIGPSTGFHHTIRRLVMMSQFGAVAPAGLLFYFASGPSFSGITDIDGFLALQSGAPTASVIDATGTSVVIDVTNACIETSSATPYMGAAPSGNEYAFPAIDLPGSDGLRLRSLVVPDGEDGCLGRNLPRHLGYTNFRWGHAMLGDGEILHADRSSTDDLIYVWVPPGQPVLNLGGWGCGIGPELAVLLPLLYAGRRLHRRAPA